MFFPIGDSQVVGGKKPFFTWIFILVNISIFLYEVSLGSQAEIFIKTYGLVPIHFTKGQSYVPLVTSMFLHGGWMHLIGNMLFLHIFGDNIEAVLGHVRYLLFYFSAGMIASCTHAFLNPDSTMPMVGASGAIAGTLGIYVMLFPHSRIKVLAFIFFFVRVFRVPAPLFLGFWIINQMISGVASLHVQTVDTGGVAWFAHIGGFIYGCLWALMFRRVAVPLQHN